MKTIYQVICVARRIVRACSSHFLQIFLVAFSSGVSRLFGSMAVLDAQAMAVSATAQGKFIADIDAKYKEIVEEGTANPLNDRERIAMRKRMNTTYKGKDVALPPATVSKYEMLSSRRHQKQKEADKFCKYCARLLPCG